VTLHEGEGKVVYKDLWGFGKTTIWQDNCGRKHNLLRMYLFFFRAFSHAWIFHMISTSGVAQKGWTPQ